ncbi:uncharacterized protein LOC129600924 [Paramacrobiotus metropolitanus]|uniref:uncharacterized protein LOC129600924 n=1 Tax=Paramacrobiotus metropolitanus TaxID=2943436 RepID=UPI002445A208|nr:uncharacterized protein LOC129600924 [Paramacrobiotus metropolitanus]
MAEVVIDRLPNGDIIPGGQSRHVETQRRRRLRQPVIEFPNYDDELKEGTQLQNVYKKAGLDKDQSVDRQPPILPLVQDETITPITDELDGRTPRRVRSQILDLERGLAMNLAGVKEDIVALSNDDFHNVIHHESDMGQIDVHTVDSEKVYVERKGRFYALSHRPLQWNASADSPPSVAQAQTSSASSIPYIYLGFLFFRRACLFSHGLLAGLALFHCIVVHTMTPPKQSNWDLFAEIYIPEAIWVKTVYQLLIAVCCVSCLCRTDLLGRVDWTLIQENSESIVALVLYFGAAALTHLCEITTVRLLMEFSRQPGISSSDMTNELSRWRIMDAVRTGCVCFGWLLLSWNWKRDRMHAHLKPRFKAKDQKDRSK